MKLNDAIKFAVDAHDGQVDKAGQPYSLHPLRVMLSVDWEVERIVAVLHDTVEDNGQVDIADIAVKFGREVAEAVDALTRRSGETYENFIKRCAENHIARRVKLADIADNLSPARSTSLPDRLRERYLTARTALSQNAVDLTLIAESASAISEDRGG